MTGSFEICCHAYAEKLPHYAAALRFHLAALVSHGSDLSVTARVAYALGDKRIEKVLDDYSGDVSARFNLVRLPMSRDRMWCRAPGRDDACRYTRSDLLWLTDVDHIILPGLLKAIHSYWKMMQTAGRLIALYWLPRYDITVDHAEGDRVLDSVDELMSSESDNSVTIDVGTVKLHRHYVSRPIGGLFILDGKAANHSGYLPGTRYQIARPETKPLTCFSDDVRFRKWAASAWGLHQLPDIQGLIRLRHSQTSYC